MAAVEQESACEVCGGYVRREDRWRRCGYCAGVLCVAHDASECQTCRERHAALRAQGQGGVLAEHAACWRESITTTLA